MRILIKERMLSAIIKTYSTESKITTTALRKLKLESKFQKFRIWLQQNNLKRNFTSIDSEQEYMMINNDNTEFHTQRVIRQFLHYEKTQRSQETQMKSQTIAALVWYNYYLLLLDDEKIKKSDIEEFNNRLKDEEDVERITLYKTLLKQQEKNKNEKKEKLFFDEFLSFEDYFYCMTMNCFDSSYTIEKSKSEIAETFDIKAESNKSLKSDIGGEISKTEELDVGTDKAIFEETRAVDFERIEEARSNRAAEAVSNWDSNDSWFETSRQDFKADDSCILNLWERDCEENFDNAYCSKHEFSKRWFSNSLDEFSDIERESTESKFSIDSIRIDSL